MAHGVLYTADRLIGFGYAIDANCFCGTALKTPSHLFFSCPLAQCALSWLQSLMFSYFSSCPSLVCRHVLFGFAHCELRSLPKLFLCFQCLQIFHMACPLWLPLSGRPSRCASTYRRVYSIVGFHLSILFKRSKSLRRTRILYWRWGAAGINGSVVDDRFVLSSF